jgi:hypothetical protein
MTVELSQVGQDDQLDFTGSVLTPRVAGLRVGFIRHLIRAAN